MNFKTMQHNNIPYQHDEWLYNEQKCSAYTCKYFNFYPYHIISFSTDTEQEMIAQIDEYVDNKEVYKIKRDLSTKAAGEFYKTLTYKGD